MGVGLFDQMLMDQARPSAITHGILVKLYKGAGYGQQSSEAVAVLYQHHGLQPPVVCSQRRGRREKLIHSKPKVDFVERRPSGSSQFSTSEFSASNSGSGQQSFNCPVPSQQFCTTPMGSMSCANPEPVGGCMQGAMPGAVSGSAGGPLPVEVQSMIHNLPEHMRNGPLVISGPYPVPASQVDCRTPSDPTPASYAACNPSPSEQPRSQPKTKKVIKI